MYFKDLCKINEEIITSRLIDDGGGGDIGGRDGDGVVVGGAQNVSEPLRSWGLLGAGGVNKITRLISPQHPSFS